MLHSVSTTKSLSIEQLQLLPQDALVESLRSRPEDQWFDRTSARTNAKHIGDILASLANAEGGLLVIGIADGRVEGVAATRSLLNEWKQAAVDFTVPPVRHRFRLVPCMNDAGAPDQLALIEVEPSEHVHETVRGDTILRIGDENRRLGPVQAMELRFDKGESIYDGTAVKGAREADLEPDLMDKYVAGIRGVHRPNIVLQSRGLLVGRDGALAPTVAGLLVLGRDPQQTFPEAYVRLIRYRGSSRETGVRANVIQDVVCGGPITAQIDAARRRLRRWIPATIRLGEAGRFARATLIPEFAWLEAIVNAVVHRSYSMAGDHTRVELFDDRLEVESPGRLPGLVRIENLRSTRFARNPRIARAVADLGYGRELGEGVNRMFEEMQRAGLPDPIYTQGSASVRVTFLADTLSGRILDALPTGLERFVEFLSRTGRVTTTQAVGLMRLSRPTALNHLHHLASLGLIEHVGTSLKDPRGYWRLHRGDGLR
jgi:ATP-dependent DNA helicase RecG